MLQLREKFENQVKEEDRERITIPQTFANLI